jgi:hypothetical protein
MTSLEAADLWLMDRYSAEELAAVGDVSKI